MAHDYVCPKHNEAQFIAMARRLGINSLTFVYRERPQNIEKAEGFAVSQALIVTNKSSPGIINLVDDAQKIRFAAEHPQVQGVFGIEKGQKDFLHHRGSGINHVIAALLAKGGKKYIVDFSLLLSSPLSERSRLMGRMAQNLAICKKFKVAVEIGSFARTPQQMRSSKDLAALRHLIERI